MKKSAAYWLGVALALSLPHIVPLHLHGAEPTLWSFLGIPQGIKKVNGALLNRSGKHPGLECKPARKAISDLANLESPNPAIKKAAEVKQAEDLKPQKIKAIRYLAKVGCGCYDTDGSITEALIAATSDCTEDVRLATVEAISDAASNKCCSNCGMTCCCKEAVVKRLAQMAYERDDTGCYLEPSQRVRQAAVRALQICCPNTEPVLIETPAEEVETPESIQREGASSAEEAREGAESDDDAADQPEPPTEDETARVPMHPQEAISSEPAYQDNTLATAALEEGTFGIVIHADSERGAAHVHIDPKNVQVPVGTLLHCYHEIDGEYVLAGRVRVYQSFLGSANVQAIEESDLNAIAMGVSCFLQELSTPADRVARVASLMPLVEENALETAARSSLPVTQVSVSRPSLQFIEASSLSVEQTGLITDRATAEAESLPAAQDIDPSLVQLRSMLRKWK